MIAPLLKVFFDDYTDDIFVEILMLHKRGLLVFCFIQIIIHTVDQHAPFNLHQLRSPHLVLS
jgi:hypothetical protein